MFGNTQPYKAVGKPRNSQVDTDLYSFKCTLKVYYVVEIEKFENKILIIKFSQKNHRDSDKKYSLNNSKRFLKTKGTTGANNFLVVMNTVTKIVLDNYLNDQNYSFGFLGSPKLKELGKNNKHNQNEDGTVNNTQRFRIYGAYLKRYFSPESFDHIEITTSSAYLVKRRNTALTTQEIELFFDHYILEYC